MSVSVFYSVRFGDNKCKSVGIQLRKYMPAKDFMFLFGVHNFSSAYVFNFGLLQLLLQ